MAIINTIKQKILQLDQGSFQNLCDQILSKEGYPNIVCLGSCTGTQKTTQGTPDTYFITENGSYVFVEYTTQLTKLRDKITSDIQKCLDVDETGIACEKISDIIYCHTSSNLPPGLYEEIYQLCKDKNISLSIWGIDRIAENLYSQNRGLAKDYLDIPFDTNQIFDVDRFVSQNDSSAFAAPLDNEFMFRNEELDAIDGILNIHDVVILSGQAGTGKTRLAIEYAKKRSANNNEILYCIRNNALPIFQDLKMYIDEPGNYLVLADDANQISGLQHILDYLNRKEDGINLKIIITVRDYALDEVRRKVFDYTEFDTVIVKQFDRDKIEEIIKKNIEIKNQQYLDRICEISNGNARIAMIAGTTAIKENSLLSLADVSKLYESYYGSVIEKFQLSNQRELLVTFGIVSFIDAFHIDRLEYIEPLLTVSQLSKDSFVECVHMLNAYELIDIYKDKAVKISEQCLSNYILKYVFFDKKLVSLSEMIKAYFPINHLKTITSVNVLTNTFYSDEMILFVEEEIGKVWEELSEENGDAFFEFVKSFYPINETATLLLLKRKISSTETINFNEDYVTENRYNSVHDDIINILGGFCRCENYVDALGLMFMYYIKRPDLYQEFLTNIKQCYIFSRYSDNNNYRVEFELLKQFKSISNNWTETPIVYLFLDVAAYLLKFRFEWTESTSDRKFRFSSIVLHQGESIINIRKNVWECLLEMPVTVLFGKCVRDIIKNYGDDSEPESIPIVKDDSTYIFKIIDQCFSSEDLGDCILVDKFVGFLRKNSLDECVNDEIVNDFLHSEKLKVYKLLVGNHKYKYDHYRDELLERNTNIKDYIVNADFSKIKEMIDVCASESIEGKYEIQEGLSILFDVLFDDTAYFVDAVKYYIECDTPNNMRPDVIIERLFQLISPEKLLELINSYNYTRKNEWLYFYYYHLPDENNSENELRDFYSMLSDDSDRFINSSAGRDINFITKFHSVDSNAFIKSCRIILRKIAYSRFIVHVYFSSLFHESITPISDLLQLFSSDMKLLEDIYLSELVFNRHFDYKGEYFKILYDNNEEFLERFFATILSQDSSYNIEDYHNQIERIYETNDYIDVFENVVELVSASKEYYFYDLRGLFNVLIRYKSKEKVDNLICTLIRRRHADMNYMGHLFESISNMSNSERSKYIKLFLEYCPGIEKFEKLPLYSSFCSWSGSEVPLIERKREFVKELFGELNGIEFLEHRNYLQKEIKRLGDRITNVQIDEILRGY